MGGGTPFVPGAVSQPSKGQFFRRGLIHELAKLKEVGGSNHLPEGQVLGCLGGLWWGMVVYGEVCEKHQECGENGHSAPADLNSLALLLKCMFRNWCPLSCPEDGVLGVLTRKGHRWGLLAKGRASEFTWSPPCRA